MFMESKTCGRCGGKVLPRKGVLFSSQMSGSAHKPNGYSRLSGVTRIPAYS